MNLEKMTLPATEGLSGESSRKRQMEDGYAPLKCQPRKRSAIRKFPPGCGPKAVVINFKHEEEVGDHKNAEEPSGIQNSDAEVDCWSNCFNDSIEVAESMDAFVRNKVTVAVDGFPNVEESMIEITSSRAEFTNEVECQILEALYRPVASGEAKLLDSSVGRNAKNLVAEFDSSEKQILTEGQTMLARLNGIEAVTLISNSDAEEAEHSLLCSTQPSPSFHSSFNVGISVIPKDNNCQRRVSAIRDFPPCCGRNHLLTQTEKQIMVQDGTQPEEVEQERNGAESELPGIILMEVPGIITFPEEKRSTSVGELVSFEEFNRNPNDIEEAEVRIAELGCGTTSNEMLDNMNEKISMPGKKETDASSLNRSHERNAQLSTHAPDEKMVPSEKDDYGIYAENLPYLSPIPIRAIPSNVDEDTEEAVGKEIIVYSRERSDSSRCSHGVLMSVDEVQMEVVQGLVAAPYCSWTKNKAVLKNSYGGMAGEKSERRKLSVRKNVKSVTRKSRSKANIQAEQSIEQKNAIINDTEVSPQSLLLVDDECLSRRENLQTTSVTMHKTQDVDVNLLPFGPKTSIQGDARNRVRETLRLFHTICRKLLQKEESNSIPGEEGILRESAKKIKRIDIHSAKIIKEKGIEINTETKFFGQIPGVEVGDEFQYRVELAIVGVHSLYQAGIDWLKIDGKPIATSIVASGAYDDDLENADVLIYSGQGGNSAGKNKKPEDQKLERGNLALKNSISAHTPVRVVRGWKETKASDFTDSKPKTVAIYVYDGLYTVERYWTETGPHGNQVFMFELKRNPGQPELAWKELKSSSKSKTRPGICVIDVSDGKEPIPICVVNTIDDAKPPPFDYTRKMIDPDWFCAVPPEGCKCSGRCGDGKNCSCADKNGGEIPYNRNGAIVEAKPLVFECGPCCKCPPSCYNRVSQRGIKFRLEVFKTESRGWGVRSLNSIPSGSFVCEYAGELLEDKEAEQRIDNDEYLFDIGQNYIDPSLKPEEVEPVEEVEAVFTIDAGKHGNVGRFINHSCAPNLYAQNVIYDHDDKRMPHVMLFAAENIPPLQELTYHYNYAVDQVHDSDGNVKVKKCYCGSAECSGRMY